MQQLKCFKSLLKNLGIEKEVPALKIYYLILVSREAKNKVTGIEANIHSDNENNNTFPSIGASDNTGGLMLYNTRVFVIFFPPNDIYNPYLETKEYLNAN